MSQPHPASESAARGAPAEVLRAFLKLGCIAFGGPIAHLGYFRQEFVERRRWLDDAAFADLVALCQFLPGPASSQVGLALGWRRAGYGGALCAWLGFTLPSAILMVAVAFGVAATQDVAHAGWVQGLKVAAVAVVAQALWSMAQTLCPDARRATLGAGGAVVLLLWPFGWVQIAVLAGGAIIGRWWLRDIAVPDAASAPLPAAGRFAGLGWLVVFAVLLIALPVLVRVWPVHGLALLDGFYRAGSLVFGGGHVVLPMLEQATVGPGWLDHDQFLAGYGAAQALPGPLFAFSAYLGAIQHLDPRGVLGGAIALLSIYAPSAFLVFGTLPQWERWRRRRAARSIVAGVNAAVVGLLGAAFYHPVWTSAITEPDRAAMAVAAFAALRFWRLPPWLIVLGAAGLGQIFFGKM